MSCGGGCNKAPATAPVLGVHPRYIPKRGAVLKKSVRGMLRLLHLTSPGASGPASSGGGRVCPAPAGAAEQGK